MRYPVHDRAAAVEVLVLPVAVQMVVGGMVLSMWCNGVAGVK